MLDAPAIKLGAPSNTQVNVHQKPKGPCNSGTEPTQEGLEKYYAIVIFTSFSC